MSWLDRAGALSAGALSRSAGALSRAAVAMASRQEGGVVAPGEEPDQFNFATGIRTSRGSVVDNLKGRPSADRWSALSVPAFLRCAAVKSGALAELPARLVDEDGMPIKNAPDFELLHDPDPDFTRFELWEATSFDMEQNGNGVWWVRDRGPMGEATEVWQVPWNRVTVQEYPRVNRIAKYRLYGEEVEPGDVMHFRGLRHPHRAVGMSPIHAYMYRTISHSLALDNASIEAVVSGSAAAGHLEYESANSPERNKRIREAWMEGAAGQSGAPFVIGDGARWVSHRRDPNALQLIEGRQFNAIEVCVMMGVKPGLIGLPTPESNAYTSALMDATHFVRFTLGPELQRYAQVLERQLPRGYHVKIDSSKLLTPDFVDRMNAYAQGIKAGMLMPDEARGWEGLTPLPEDYMPPGAESQMAGPGREPPPPGNVPGDDGEADGEDG